MRTIGIIRIIEQIDKHRVTLLALFYLDVKKNRFDRLDLKEVSHAFLTLSKTAVCSVNGKAKGQKL